MSNECNHPLCPDEPNIEWGWSDWADEHFEDNPQVQCHKCKLWICEKHGFEETK